VSLSALKKKSASGNASSAAVNAARAFVHRSHRSRACTGAGSGSAHAEQLPTSATRPRACGAHVASTCAALNLLSTRTRITVRAAASSHEAELAAAEAVRAGSHAGGATYRAPDAWFAS